MHFNYKKICICFICTLLSLFLSCSFVALENKNYNFIYAEGGDKIDLVSQSNPIKRFFENIFNPQASKEEFMQSTEYDVYVGGIPLGFALDCDGVIIVSAGEVLTANGPVNPSLNSGIKAGDILYEINGQKIESAETISQILNSPDYAGKQVNCNILRNGAKINIALIPALDITTNLFKLGLWIRDDAAGVGTLTYVRADNLRFGALGHPVCDIDTNSILPIKSGEIYSCDIIGVNRGKRGTPGELKGIFLRNGVRLGDLDNNTGFGVFGKINEDEFNLSNLQKMQTASSGSIKLGPATVRCTIDGEKPQDYSIEIIKINSSNKDSKNMIIRITDKELLDKTGGIVQGMSGSPIIQNGKLIGAITHVFVSDPTKGFATLISNMIES